MLYKCSLFNIHIFRNKMYLKKIVTLILHIFIKFFTFSNDLLKKKFIT